MHNVDKFIRQTYFSKPMPYPLAPDYQKKVPLMVWLFPIRQCWRI
ncbi:hypothetical protein [Vibrio quintilis]|nr:hypothetical protein [Vibrio quintilis]